MHNVSNSIEQIIDRPLTDRATDRIDHAT